MTQCWIENRITHETMEILCIIYVNPFLTALIISRSIVTAFVEMMCAKIMGFDMKEGTF